MARAQLSVEFLIYLSLAGFSLLSCISLFKGFSLSLSGSIAYYELSDFVSKTNLAISLGENSYNFSLPLPHSICNSTFSGTHLLTPLGNFSFIEPILEQNGTLCNSRLSGFSLITLPNQTRLLVMR